MYYSQECGGRILIQLVLPEHQSFHRVTELDGGTSNQYIQGH